MAWYWYVIIAVGAYLIACIAYFVVVGKSFKPGLQNEAYGDERYNELKEKGVETDHKVYTDEEIAKDPAKGTVRLIYMPVDSGEKTKYMLVCPGGGYLNLSTSGEGYCIGRKANEAGYTAFVLEYRVGENCSDHAPLEDLGMAIQFINANADKFNVESEGYSICGFSAGGNLIGLFGTDKYGYKNFDGVAKPAAILMGYPWCNPNERVWNILQFAIIHGLNKRGCGAFLSGDVSQKSLDTMRVHKHLTSDYPATYIMQGDYDVLVPKKTHADVLVKGLKENNVTYKYDVYHNVNHGCGLCVGGAAEGWIDNALAFWKEQM